MNRQLRQLSATLLFAVCGTSFAQHDTCSYSSGADCIANASRALGDSQQRGTTVAPLLAISDIVGQGRRGQASGRLPGRAARVGFPVAGEAETGLAGAVKGPRWNGWVALAHSQLDYEWQPLRSGGDVNATLLGLDYRFSDKGTFGASLSFDETKIATTFNNGSLTGHGYSFTPYLAWQFNDVWSLDASAGAGKGKSKSIDNAAGGVTGSNSANRWFGAVNLNYTRWVGNWEFGGKATLLQTEEKKGQFTLSNGTLVNGTTNRLGQVRLAAQAGYFMAEGVHPYVGLAYVSDYQRANQTNTVGFARNPANDRDGWVYTGGVNFISKGAFSGGLMLQHEDRREQKQTSITANLAYRF